MPSTLLKIAAAHDAGADRDVEHLTRPVGMDIGNAGHFLPIGWIGGPRRTGSYIRQRPGEVKPELDDRLVAIGREFGAKRLALLGDLVECRCLIREARRTVRFCASWRTNWNVRRVSIRSRSH